jgi:hypothetical protein
MSRATRLTSSPYSVWCARCSAATSMLLPANEPRMSRSLGGTLFRAAIGRMPPRWSCTVDDLAAQRSEREVLGTRLQPPVGGECDTQ